MASSPSGLVRSHPFRSLRSCVASGGTTVRSLAVLDPLQKLGSLSKGSARRACPERMPKVPQLPRASCSDGFVNGQHESPWAIVAKPSSLRTPQTRASGVPAIRHRKHERTVCLFGRSFPVPVESTQKVRQKRRPRRVDSRQLPRCLRSTRFQNATSRPKRNRPCRRVTAPRWFETLSLSWRSIHAANRPHDRLRRTSDDETACLR